MNFLPPFLSFIVPFFHLSSFISPPLPPTTAGTGSGGGGLSSSLSLCLLPLSATCRPDCLAHCPPSALTLCPLCLPQVRGHGLHQQGVVRDIFAVTYVVRRSYECEQCIHFKSHFCLAYYRRTNRILADLNSHVVFVLPENGNFASLSTCPAHIACP